VRAGAPDGLTVGYLHLGKAESGVLRYGRLIAQAASRRPDIRVVEADAGARDATLTDLRRAARSLRAADVVHVQWKQADWGTGLQVLPRLELVLDVLRRPLIVTLHDVYPRVGIRERWLESGALALHRLTFGSRGLVVHSREERRRLTGLVPEQRLTVVPHFVEQRPAVMDREEAKRRLDLQGQRVVTLLGHLVRRKGHALMLEALAQLPADVTALFVGSPIEGREARGEELRTLAGRLGVTQRVRFTGYVPDQELSAMLAATDVAVCPYRDMSASGALATWISTGRPIVASDLPQMRELNELSPGALRTFSPLEPAPLAEALEAALDPSPPEVDPAVDRLRQRLEIPRIVERYLDVYRTSARRG
jgi:glycosyltransferase involved in cell wall biosynthesis